VTPAREGVPQGPLLVAFLGLCLTALAGPALAGIPATTRETNHAVILAAGYRALAEEAEKEWAALAATGQPIILYMAMPHLDVIARAFQSGGLSADTPVTIIASATLEVNHFQGRLAAKMKSG